MTDNRHPDLLATRASLVNTVQLFNYELKENEEQRVVLVGLVNRAGAALEAFDKAHPTVAEKARSAARRAAFFSD